MNGVKSRPRLTVWQRLTLPFTVLVIARGWHRELTS